jgi:ABC-type nickel/cobalt efflux system permease component RcnA
MDLLLSQVANNTDVPPWFQIGSGVFGSGFALWYAWYSTTKIIPRMQRNHTEQVSQLHKQYADIINRLVGEFRQDSKEQRAAEASRTGLVVDAINHMTEAFKDMRDDMGSRVHK